MQKEKTVHISIDLIKIKIYIFRLVCCVWPGRCLMDSYTLPAYQMDIAAETLDSAPNSEETKEEKNRKNKTKNNGIRLYFFRCHNLLCMPFVWFQKVLCYFGSTFMCFY